MKKMLEKIQIPIDETQLFHEEEEWKNIPHTNYSVSKYGEITHDAGFRNVTLTDDGYEKFTAYHFLEKRTKSFMVHRVVAELFISNPEEKNYVDHIDRNKRNNKVSNLRWVTRAENNLNRDTGGSVTVYEHKDSKGNLVTNYIIGWWSQGKAERKSFRDERQANYFLNRVLRNSEGVIPRDINGVVTYNEAWMDDFLVEYEPKKIKRTRQMEPTVKQRGKGNCYGFFFRDSGKSKFPSFTTEKRADDFLEWMKGGKGYIERDKDGKILCDWEKEYRRLKVSYGEKVRN